MKKTCETDTSGSSDDGFVSKSAAHMLRIKTLKSVSCVEESATDTRFLEKEDVNFPDQQKQGMEAIIQMRDELHRHTQEIEMRLEQKLSEFIVQMSVLINTEALVVPCDKTASMKMKDETNNDSQRQSHMNRIIVQWNNSLPPQQTQNDGCVSIGNDDKLRKEDSDWEDSSFRVYKRTILPVAVFFS